MSVGVGGYLLGGGVNFSGTSNKYGFGAEHVLAYEMVTAEGDIATVEEGKTIITRSRNNSSKSSGLVKEEIKYSIYLFKVSKPLKCYVLGTLKAMT